MHSLSFLAVHFNNYTCTHTHTGTRLSISTPIEVATYISLPMHSLCQKTSIHVVLSIFLPIINMLDPPAVPFFFRLGACRAMVYNTLIWRTVLFFALNAIMDSYVFLKSWDSCLLPPYPFPLIAVENLEEVTILTLKKTVN